MGVMEERFAPHQIAKIYFIHNLCALCKTGGHVISFAEGIEIKKLDESGPYDMSDKIIFSYNTKKRFSMLGKTGNRETRTRANDTKISFKSIPRQVFC